MNDLFLIAHIAGRGVAIEGRVVDSVVDIGAITPVPRAPTTVRGLAALRSRVVTVIDTRVALGLVPTETPGRAVIAHLDGHFYAFLIDDVDDVAPFERRPLASSSVAGRGWGADASGLIVRDGQPLVVLDLLGLVPSFAEPA